MDKTLHTYRAIAAMAKERGIIASIPASDEDLSIFIENLFEHFGVVVEKFGDNLPSTLT